MRVKEEYKKIGKFWMPSNENNKIHGTLFIKDGGEIELEIIGMLSQSDYIRRIIGYVEQEGLVTLDQCSFRRGSFSNGISRNIFYVERVFFGIQYKEQEETYFNSFCFSIERLLEWIDISGIKLDKSDEQECFSIKYEQPKEISYQIVNKDIQINFQFDDWARSGSKEKDETTIQITERTHINIVSSKKLPLEDFISIARKIANFICFAMNNIVCMNSISVISNEIKNNNDKPVSIKLYYRSRPFLKNTDGRKSELFLHSYNGIKQNMEKIINNWLYISDKTYPAFELYLSTQEAEHQFLESKFLTLVQSLDAYHRREIYSNDKINLKQRITEIMNPFKGYIGDDQKCEKIITSIINTRNYLTHYNPKKEKKAVKGQELYVFCLMLEGLFQLTLLEKIGIFSQRIDFIATQILKYKLKNKFLPV